MKKVAIIDYGMSNLLSICRAFEHVGAEVKIVHTPEEIASAGYLVLPGVGAFPDGMKELNERNLTGSIRQYAASGKPLLGICLGMQMLLSRGFEYNETPGLAIIPGDVLPLPLNIPSFKVPNINWHAINEPIQGRWKNTLMENTAPSTCYYFVHSYYASPSDESNILAVSDFGDLKFAAAVIKDNVVGTQFHPEKSGEDGLQLLRNFLNK